MRTPLIFTVVVLLSMAFSPVASATMLGSPTNVSFTASYDGSAQDYYQLLPTDYVSTKTYDVVIALHGSGSNGLQYATNPADEMRATRDAAGNNDMIMICPNDRGTTSWMNAPSEADLVQIIQNLKSTYHVGNVILTGASMGGTGTLTFTALHPNLINGMCSVNGLANFDGYHSSNTDLAGQITTAFGGTQAQVPAEYYKRSAINFPQSFTMPMSIATNGGDTVVPAASVVSLYNTVKNTNTKAVSFYRSTGNHSTNYVDNAVALEYVIRQAKGINTDLHPIAINRSFEYQKLSPGTTASTVDGWTPAGGSVVGVANLSAANYTAKYNDPIPDGSQAAMATNSALYQFTGTTIRAGTYHLSLVAASPKDNSHVGTLLTGFMVADNNVASSADLDWGATDSYTAGPGLTPGEWTTINVDWVVGANSPAIGKYLYLDFWANSSNTVYFDNVSLSFTPLPEPSTFVMLGTAMVGLLVYARRKRK
jgi:pimeloyl-ACP methyl ester carboxylesterase